MMKLKLLVLAVLLWSVVAFGQMSYWASGFNRQGNAQLAQQYFFRAGSNVVITFTNPYVYINAGGDLTNPPTPPTPPPGPTNLTQGLVAWYKVDEGSGVWLYDSHVGGQNVPALISGAPPVLWAASGNPYNGGPFLRYDSGTALIATTTWPPTFDLGTYSQFSICIWANHTNMSWSTWEGLVCSVPTLSYLLRYDANLAANITLYCNGPNLILTGPTPAEFGQNVWHFIVVSRNGNNYEMWMDGNSVATGSSATPIVNGANYASIGRDTSGGAGRNWNGLLGETRFYAGYALTDADVKYLYYTYYLNQPVPGFYVLKSGDTMTGALNMQAPVMSDYAITNNVFGGIICSNVTITNQWTGWSAARTELNGYGLLVAAPIGPTLNMEQLGQGIHPPIGPGTISFVDSIFYPGGTVRTGFWVSHPMYLRDEMRVDGLLSIIDGNNAPNTWVSNGVIKTKTNFASTSFIGGIYYGDGSGLTNIPLSTNATYVLQSPLTNAVTNFTVSLAQLPDAVLTNFDTRSWTNNSGSVVVRGGDFTVTNAGKSFPSINASGGKVGLGQMASSAQLTVAGSVLMSSFTASSAPCAVSDATDATTPTSASALKVSGGLSVAKQIVSGSNGFFGGTVSATNGLYYYIAQTNSGLYTNVWQPVHSFGSMMMYTTNTINGGANTYAVITNYTTARSNLMGCSLATGTITPSISGFYYVAIHLSGVSVDNGATVEGDLLLNNVVKDEVSFLSAFDPGTPRIKGMSAFGILYITNNTPVTFQIKSSGANGVTLSRAQMVLSSP